MVRLRLLLLLSALDNHPSDPTQNTMHDARCTMHGPQNEKMTQRVKEKLKEMGYTAEQIFNMSPDIANKIISMNLPPSRVEIITREVEEQKKASQRPIPPQEPPKTSSSAPPPAAPAAAQPAAPKEAPKAPKAPPPSPSFAQSLPPPKRADPIPPSSSPEIPPSPPPSRSEGVSFMVRVHLFSSRQSPTPTQHETEIKTDDAKEQR